MINVLTFKPDGEFLGEVRVADCWDGGDLQIYPFNDPDAQVLYKAREIKISEHKVIFFIAPADLHWIDFVNTGGQNQRGESYENVYGPEMAFHIDIISKKLTKENDDG